MSYRYRAYGITCFSDTFVPGFFPHTTPQSLGPDIFLELNREPPDWVYAARKLPAHLLYRKPLPADLSDSVYTISVLGSEEFFEFAYSDGTHFVIEGSCERLWGTCPAPHSVDYLATYLRGPVMGFILRRLGVTALHASAVSLFGQAVALCGASQSGKSTTAAALALRGTPVLCDDVTPVHVVGDGFYVEPGYTHIGLWPDAVRNLLGTAEALPRWTPSWEKCFLALDGQKAHFANQAQSLGAIYLLDRRTSEINAPRIESVGRREGLLHLVQHTYMNWLLNRRQRAEEFDLLSRLVSRVPLRRVVLQVDPAQIPALFELISTDAESLLADHCQETAAATS